MLRQNSTACFDNPPKHDKLHKIRHGTKTGFSLDTECAVLPNSLPRPIGASNCEKFYKPSGFIITDNDPKTRWPASLGNVDDSPKRPKRTPTRCALAKTGFAQK